MVTRQVFRSNQTRSISQNTFCSWEDQTRNSIIEWALCPYMPSSWPVVKNLSPWNNRSSEYKPLPREVTPKPFEHCYSLYTHPIQRVPRVCLLNPHLKKNEQDRSTDQWSFGRLLAKRKEAAFWLHPIQITRGGRGLLRPKQTVKMYNFMAI